MARKEGKRIRQARELVNSDKSYSLDEALDFVATYSSKFKTKFDESVEIVMKLGVDPKQSDQLVRGAVPMPNGLGKDVRVAVFCDADKIAEAKKAGADIFGSEELVDIVKGGKIDFDVAIATPAMMVSVSKLGRVLGPRGLMPNPKLGTVTDNIKDAVATAKSGQAEFKVEKGGLVHAAVGKVSFSAKALKENIVALYGAVVAAKPTASKGMYMQNAYISTSQGPAIRLDIAKVMG